MKNITRLFAIVLLLLTSCNSASKDTLTLADKVADEFGRTPANMLKKINRCQGVGRSNCKVRIYFSTSKDRTTLESTALKVGIRDWGGGNSTRNLLEAIECVEGRLTINGECLKDYPATDAVKNVPNFSWGGDINHHWTYVAIYEVSSGSGDIYALDGKPMTENIIELVMGDQKP